MFTLDYYDVRLFAQPINTALWVVQSRIIWTKQHSQSNVDLLWLEIAVGSNT